jgi:hypothetical protein
MMIFSLIFELQPFVKAKRSNFVNQLFEFQTVKIEPVLRNTVLKLM